MELKPKQIKFEKINVPFYILMTTINIILWIYCFKMQADTPQWCSLSHKANKYFLF